MEPIDAISSENIKLLPTFRTNWVGGFICHPSHNSITGQRLSRTWEGIFFIPTMYLFGRRKEVPCDFPPPRILQHQQGVQSFSSPPTCSIWVKKETTPTMTKNRHTLSISLLWTSGSVMEKVCGGKKHTHTPPTVSGVFAPRWALINYGTAGREGRRTQSRAATLIPVTEILMQNFQSNSEGEKTLV